MLNSNPVFISMDDPAGSVRIVLNYSVVNLRDFLVKQEQCVINWTIRLVLLLLLFITLLNVFIGISRKLKMLEENTAMTGYYLYSGRI